MYAFIYTIFHELPAMKLAVCARRGTAVSHAPTLRRRKSRQAPRSCLHLMIKYDFSCWKSIIKANANI